MLISGRPRKIAGNIRQDFPALRLSCFASFLLCVFLLCALPALLA
jgi:hypothetical protein